MDLTCITPVSWEILINKFFLGTVASPIEPIRRGKLGLTYKPLNYRSRRQLLALSPRWLRLLVINLAVPVNQFFFTDISPFNDIRRADHRKPMCCIATDNGLSVRYCSFLDQAGVHILICAWLFSFNEKLFRHRKQNIFNKITDELSNWSQ